MHSTEWRKICANRKEQNTVYVYLGVVDYSISQLLPRHPTKVDKPGHCIEVGLYEIIAIES